MSFRTKCYYDVVLSPEQRKLADQAFEQALLVPPDQRRLFLEQNCTDPVVRSEVGSLLRYSSDTRTAMDKAILEAAAAWASPEWKGWRVGPYRLTGRVGQGGMGTVYRAVRDDDQFQKTVAIKMLRFPDGDQDLLQRLRQERQILATLEHPNIARLLDGGAWTPPGGSEAQPYIVMEFVEGQPLTDYALQHRLNLRQRLELFRQVCDSLSYAHRQLVVHRDIKPGNILVTPGGTPKLLDFGIAKLLSATTPEAASTALLALTPGYASPEQVRGEPISTLTDVYSLGAVLYELLSGRPARALVTHDSVTLVREMCERDVPAPRVDPELDVIVLHAMHKEPARRYQSVEQFSEDIGRYLDGLPIRAKEDTLGYRATKYVRRNLAGVLAAAALFVALTGGIAVSAWQARRASRAQEATLAESEKTRAERDRALQAEKAAQLEQARAEDAERLANTERGTAIAERERANDEAGTSQAVTDFLRNDLLAQAAPGNQAGSGLTVRQAVDRAAARIDGKFPGKPLVESAVRSTLADTYYGLGRFEEAQQQYQHAADLRRAVKGGRDREALDLLTSVAAALRQQDKLKEAENLYLKILAIQSPAFGDDDRDTLTTLGNLAVVYRHEEKHQEAEALNQKVLDIQIRKFGQDDIDTLRTMNNLSVNYTRQGKFDQAAATYRRVLELRRRKQGPEHPTTLLTMTNLAAVYVSQQSNYGEAESLYQQALAIQRRDLGPEHRDTLLTLTNLGTLQLEEGKLSAAEQTFQESAGMLRRTLGPLSAETLEAFTSLGDVRLRQKQYPQAETTLRQVVRDFETAKTDSWVQFYAQLLLGASVAAQGRFEEAEPLLLSGREGLLRRQALIPTGNRNAIERAGQSLLDFYKAWGKPELAADWAYKAAISPGSKP